MRLLGIYSCLILLTALPLVSVSKAAPAIRPVDDLARDLLNNVRQTRASSAKNPLLSLGKLHFQQGRLQEAVRSFQKAAKTYKGIASLQSRLLLGRTYAAMKEEGLARDTFRDVIA